jgi:hypothetical protein
MFGAGNATFVFVILGSIPLIVLLFLVYVALSLLLSCAQLLDSKH